MFIVQTKDRIYAKFVPNLQFFYRIILQDKLQSFNIQDALPFHNKLYKMEATYKRFYLENSLPLNGTVQSGHDAVM